MFGLVLLKLRNDGENAAFAPFAIAADFASLTAPVNPDTISVADIVFANWITSNISTYCNHPPFTKSDADTLAFLITL